MSWCPYFSVCFDLVTSIQKFFSGSYPVSLICRYLELYYLGPSFLEFTSKRRIFMICTMAYWVFNIFYDPINTLVLYKANKPEKRNFCRDSILSTYNCSDYWCN
jgi:hypothetical protein